MARFELRTVTINDPDGVDREYQLIVDRSTLQRVLLHEPDDYVTVGRGFLRCQGKRYIATYGQHTPVYAGSEDQVYYAPFSLFDGLWAPLGPNSRGLHDYVTAASGTGRLFAELEAFAAEQELPVIA